MQQFALCVAVISCATFGSAGRASAASEKSTSAANEAARLIEEWRFPEAEAVIAEMLSAHPDDPIANVLDANLKFQLGDYDGAAERFQILQRTRDVPQGWRELSDLVDSTRSATKGYAEAKSPEGHFIIRYAPGKDEYLLPYAFEALEAARREIGVKDFEAGTRLGDPVRVEIYPEVADLAKVSTLTEREIETSGTIAICKFNKLMVTSPRALVHGYPWLDTLAHEYTHFIITRVSRNTAPIWLHEGLAKFEERRWRAPKQVTADGGGLTPTMEHLLASAIAGAPDHKGGRPRRLITFEEMYPSMAKLPSQEDSALAFAEVYTVVEYLHAKKGWAGVRQVLDKMRDGEEDSKAVAAVMGQSFEDFQRAWKAWLKGRKLRLHPGIAPATMRFAHGKQPKDDKDEADSADVAEERARKFVRLGGLLRSQNRLAPAAMEYEKAQQIVGPGHIVIAGRLARTLLAIGELDKAIAAATPAYELYPSEGGGLAATLGEAWWKKKDAAKAAPYLEAALRTNPFDPKPHCFLRDIYTERSDPRTEREQRACAGLSN